MLITITQAALIDQGLSTPDSAVRVWVIPTDEESMIARHTGAVVAGSEQA